MHQFLPDVPRAALIACAGVAATACHAVVDPALVRQREQAVFDTAPPAAAADAPAAPAPTAADVAAGPDLATWRRYALHHSAGLRAAFDGWRAAVERVPQVTSLPDPQFTFAWFVEQVQTRTGPQQRRYQLTQMLPFFGKLGLRGDVARGGAEEAWWRVQATRLGVQRDVEVAYHDYAFLGRQTGITREVLALLRQTEPVVQRRIQGGAGQEDLLRLQVEIGRVENELASLEQVRPAMSARLAAAMQWSGPGVLPLPELGDPGQAGTAPPTDELLRLAAEHNPALREHGERVRTREAARDLARREAWPDLAVGVDYIETGAAVAPVSGSGDDPVAVSFKVDLPLWRARYTALEREAEHRLAAAEHELVGLRADLRADIELAAFHLGDAGRQVRLYRDSLLPRAREALEVTRASYRAAGASLLDLIDSERALLQLETAYWRACRDHAQSRARLVALIGGEW